MADKIIIIVHNEESQDYGPRIYLDWDGKRIPTLLREWWKYMGGRRGDVRCGTARLVGIAHNTIDGNRSLGVMRSAAHAYPPAMRYLLQGDYAIGDEGTIHVDAETGIVVEQWGRSGGGDDITAWDLNDPPKTP